MFLDRISKRGVIFGLTKDLVFRPLADAWEIMTTFPDSASRRNGRPCRWWVTSGVESVTTFSDLRFQTETHGGLP